MAKTMRALSACGGRGGDCHQLRVIASSLLKVTAGPRLLVESPALARFGPRWQSPSGIYHRQ